MKVAQGLARHSTISLTAGYTHMALAVHTAALAALPALDSVAAPAKVRQVATGTNGKPADELAPANAESGAEARSACAARLAANDGNDRHDQAVAGRIGCDDLGAGNTEKSSVSGKAWHAQSRTGENAPRRTRTFNPLIKSQMLYQLS